MHKYLGYLMLPALLLGTTAAAADDTCPYGQEYGSVVLKLPLCLTKSLAG